MNKLVWTAVCALLSGGVQRSVRAIEHGIVALTRPANPGVLHGAISDTTRSKNGLIVENALLRQQLIVLRRQIRRPHCTARDRLLLVQLARCAGAWKEALLIVQPDTLLRWQRAGFRLVWRVRSRGKRTPPKIAAETIPLIQQMATENRF